MKRILVGLLALLPLAAIAESSVIITGNGNSVSGSGGTVTINGKTYTGNNISINGNNVIVDGKRQGSALERPIWIVVNGNVESVTSSSGNVQVAGTVGKVKTMSGDVLTKGDILGSASTMSGDIRL